MILAKFHLLYLKGINGLTAQSTVIYMHAFRLIVTAMVQTINLNVILLCRCAKLTQNKLTSGKYKRFSMTVNETEASIFVPRKSAKKMDAANELQKALHRHTVTMLQLQKPGNEIVNGELQAIANPPLHDIADEPAGQAQVEGQMHPQY